MVLVMRTEKEIVEEVDRLLVELEEGYGEYEGEGADGFRQLQKITYSKGSDGKTRTMLDWERTKRNVKDYMKALRYAIVEVRNWRVVDMMLYPVPGFVATPGLDDPLTYAADELAELKGDGNEIRRDDCGPEGCEARDCDKILRWALANITFDNMTEDTGTFLLDEASMSAARMALDWAREKVARKCSELVME